ncbi:MAG: hypothetical protein WCA46_28795 [Actinocatenispora sp.]
MTPQTGRRCHNALNPLHSLSYFAPEMEKELTSVGLRPGRMCYFANRSAAMGAVGPGVVTATFYNFKPALVAKHIPRAWTLAAPADVLAARLRAVDAALRRLLGEQVVTGPEVAEAAALAQRATQGCDPAARPVYAGHAELPWPSEPHLVLWHAITLLREYRGDGHFAALLSAGLDGLDALVTHIATGKAFTREFALSSRGWTDEEWDAAERRLRERGLLDEDGGLTEEGRALRGRVEDDTDRLAAAPYESLGADDVARLTELGAELSRTAVGNGAFPAGVFAR